MAKKSRTPYIICGGSIGRCLVFGWLDAEPKTDEPVTIYDARMVLRYPAECGGVFGLAANGPRDGLRLTAALARVTDTCRQSLTVSPEAARALSEWPSA